MRPQHNVNVIGHDHPCEEIVLVSCLLAVKENSTKDAAILGFCNH